jgi:hypothetical protein
MKRLIGIFLLVALSINAHENTRHHRRRRIVKVLAVAGMIAVPVAAALIKSASRGPCEVSATTSSGTTSGQQVCGKYFSVPHW